MILFNIVIVVFCTLACVDGNILQSLLFMNNAAVVFLCLPPFYIRHHTTTTVTVVNKPPTISCEKVTNKVAEKLNETVTVVLRNPTTYDPEGNEVIVTKSGDSPNSTYGMGQHVIIYTAVDDVGNKAVCEVRFQVTVIYCLENLNVVNGRVDCIPRNQIFGTKCTITCHTGYVLLESSDATRSCEKVGDRGAWSPSNSVVCEKKNCSKPQEPCNGHLSCSSTDYEFESVCYPVCNKGYAIDQTQSLVCNGDKWIGSVQSCEDIQPPKFTSCPATLHRFAESDGKAIVRWKTPEAEDNSRYADECGASTDLKIQQVSGMSSGSSFKIGYHEIKYTATDGSNNEAYCTFTVIIEELLCEPLFVRDQFLSVNCPDGYQYGSSCSFNCYLSYQLMGDKVVKCDKDPNDINKAFWNWTNRTETYCKKLTCPDLPAPVGGALACSEALGNKICTLSCSDKYQVAKSTPIEYVCNDNQVWIQGIPPNCTEKVHPENAFKPGELFYYYSGSCSNTTVQDGIKDHFVKAMEELNRTAGWNNICPAYCTVDGVTVTCGPLNGRRRRSIEVQITLNFRVSSEWETDKDLNGNDDILSALSTVVTNIVSTGRLDVPGVTTGNIAFGWTTLSCPLGQEPDYSKDGGCVGCPPGKYLTNKECVDCPKGFYQQKEYQINCTQCPRDQSTSATGSKSFNDCKDMCLPGSYSANGLVPCTPCPLGQYQNAYGSTICLPCPMSTFTLSSGSTQNASCLAMDITMTSSNSAIEMQPLSRKIFSFSLGLFIKCPNTSMDITLTLAGFNFTFGNQISVNITNQSFGASFPIVNRMKWTHISVTWDSTTKEANIYKGGENIGSRVFVSVSPQDVEIKTGSYLTIQGYDSACSFTGLFLSEGVLSQSSIEYLSMSCDAAASEQIFSMTDAFLATKHGVEISQSTCDAFDECTSNPCGYNNPCFDKLNTYECVCNGGYVGVKCDIPPDFCISNKCKNGATCLSHFAKYTCQCSPDFYGFFCENAIINGNWGPWIESSCSKSCGSGLLTRVRSCNNPIPGPNGRDCPGSNMTEDICNTDNCPVCPHFSTIYEFKNSFNCNSTADATQCKVTCQTGYVFMKYYQPLDLYECGPHTAFQWNARPPPCVATNSPLAAQANIAVKYYVDCNDKNQLTTDLSNNLEKLQCAQNGTCKVTTTALGCSALNRKRRSSQYLDVSIQLYSVFAIDNLNLEDFEENNTISPGLSQLLNTYSDYEASIFQLNNSNLLTVNDPNGKIYVADKSSFSLTTSVKCPAGTIEQDLLCADCPVGTYWYNSLCVMCPKGTYQNENRQLQCNACPDGFTTLYIASRNVTECTVPFQPSSTIAKTFSLPVHASSDQGKVIEIVVPIVVITVSVATIATIAIIKIRTYMRRTRRCQSTLGSMVSLNMVRPTLNVH